jgi:hypothetical protein
VRRLVVLVATLVACGGPHQPGPTSLEPHALATLRDLVFADQDLDQVVALQKDSPVDDAASPWPHLASAARLRGDDPESAVAELEEVLELPGVETRVQLWTWTALRALGVSPDAASADVVQGVVVEMPAGGDHDTLAVFRDGTMRYFDHAGRAVFWDAHEGASTADTAALVAKPIALAEGMSAGARGPLSAGRPPVEAGTVRVTFLAFGGSRRCEAPAGRLTPELAPLVEAASAAVRRASAGSH